MLKSAWIVCFCVCTVVLTPVAEESWVPKEFQLFNVVPPVFPAKGDVEPATVTPFIEHVRGNVDVAGDVSAATGITIVDGSVVLEFDAVEAWDGHPVTARATVGERTWIGTDSGLYVQTGGETVRHDSYGVNGPLATKITGLAVDSKSVLWVGTPLGLSCKDADGVWKHLRGTEGMPVENVTALVIDRQDNLWIGTSHGAILYKPYATGRQWFYRAGKRYLPGDTVRDVAVAKEGSPVYFLTDGGLGKIDLVTTTLLEKANTIEDRVNKYHRRLGLVADCTFESVVSDATHTIGDNDNDGLWTAYHVAAMSLCYGATKDPAAKASAREGMHALYMLQNASGTPGLVARSVLPPEIGSTRDEQWRPTPDGAMYWKSDTSSDEIDGHYLAFYAYYEHIAKDDPQERELIEKQVRAVTDYIVNNNYQLIDWDGKRTRWGFWNPELLNENPLDYVESGLNALQILSFLKVAHYITGDPGYEAHFRKLAVDHHYLSNILLTKRCFPDENNHSDDQLGFVAWYPILQLEKDPQVRKALLSGVRRHYAVVKPEKPSFYTFVYASIDPSGADLQAAVENLMEIPTDRRTYAMKNSHRADVEFASESNRFNQPVLTRVLSADERNFEKWNADPYRPDGGGDGRSEDDGAAYLLPYWMAQYHGFIREIHSDIGDVEKRAPKCPYIQQNICPFEGCQYGHWTAKSSLKVYADEGDKKVIAFTIEPNEEFDAIRGNVHITKPGIVIVEKAFEQFHVGDKIYLLSYRGEGVYDLWYDNQVLDMNFDEVIYNNTSLVELPEFIWWVEIVNKDGKKGWLGLANISGSGFDTGEGIEGMDMYG